MQKIMKSKASAVRGFCLLEVLVTVFIVTTTLISLMAMQTVIKKSTYASKQRTQATHIAQSIVESLKVNRKVLQTPANLKLLESIMVSSQSISAPKCNACSPDERLLVDIISWHNALKGEAVKQQGVAIAGLNKADACVTHDAKTGNIQVVVSWQDKTEAKELNSKSPCGVANASRRQLILNSSIVQA